MGRTLRCDFLPFDRSLANTEHKFRDPLKEPSMPKPTLQRDPLSATARDVLALFSDVLAEVRFPDVDRHSLESAADELRALQLEVERLEAELEAARANVLAQSETLNVKAERGLAYARIYAASDAKLSARVAEITQEKPPTLAGAAPKKRGRARKGDGDANLFGTVHDDAQELSDAPSLAEEHAA